MKFKPALRYYFKDNQLALILFYVILVLLFAVLGVELKAIGSDGTSTNYGGFDVAALIFIFILGLNAFGSPFGVFMQNGVSRKTAFFSFLAAAGIISVAMAALDCALSSIAKAYLPYRTVFDYIYTREGGMTGLTGFIWNTAAFFGAATLGYMITVLFYRAGKAVRPLIAAGIPVLLFIILPLADAFWVDGKIGEALVWFMRFILGFKAGRSALFSALCFICLAAFFALISWLGVRRAAAKRVT